MAITLVILNSLRSAVDILWFVWSIQCPFACVSVPGYPMPPNTTLASATYNSRYLTEVELEWETESDEQLTGFILEHRWVSEKPGRTNSHQSRVKEEVEEEDGVSTQAWYRNIIEDPEVRSQTVKWLTPTATYQFRVTPVNHRTIGHPSAPKTPGKYTKPGVCLDVCDWQIGR